MAFSLSVKTNKEEEHPVVSEGECKQDSGGKVMLATKLMGVRKKEKVNVCAIMELNVENLHKLLKFLLV